MSKTITWKLPINEVNLIGCALTDAAIACRDKGYLALAIFNFEKALEIYKLALGAGEDYALLIESLEQLYTRTKAALTVQQIESGTGPIL